MADFRLDLSRIDQDIGQSYDAEEEEDSLEDNLEELDPLGDDYSPEDKLSALERLDKYFQSEDLGERDLAIRYIAEAAPTVTNYGEFDLLLEIAFSLANDHEPIIRTGVLGTMGYLLDRNSELGQMEDGEELAAEYEERLFNIPIRMLSDINQQVRRVSQNCILAMIEEEKGNRDVLLQQLCPVIVRCLSRDENYDLRMDTTLLISRVAPLLGKEVCMKQFVHLLPPLGTDTMFHVRKAFAMSCKELCPVLGEESTEEHILPIFLTLCEDDVWGVRKACADTFPDVSVACNLGTRHDQLTPAFLKLLHDDSRWVRKAAYQSLGPFISTFYVPQDLSEESYTNFDDSLLEPLGDSVLMDNSLLASSVLSSVGNETQDPSSEDRHTHPTTSSDAWISSTPVTKSTGVGQGGESRVASETEKEFNSFHFWRSPIPSVGTDLQLEDLEREGVTPDRVRDVSTSSSSSEDVPVKQEPTPAESVGEADKDLDGAERRSDLEVKARLTFEGTDPSTVGTQTERRDADTEREGEERPSVSTQESQSESNREEEQEEGAGEEGREREGVGVGETKGKTVQEGEIEIEKEREKDTAAVAGETGPAERAESGGESRQLPDSRDTNTSSQGQEVPSAREAWNVNTPVASVEERLNQTQGHKGTQSPRGAEKLKQTSGGDKSLGAATSVEDLQEKAVPSDNSVFPQVRVFVHSTNGQVMEQDLSLVGHEAGEDPVALHDHTTTRSVAMDLTLGESLATEDFIPAVQEIVPDELMEVFLSMTEQIRAQSVDSDLPFYCVYSLPGVALTLGPEHWAVLKPTFDVLAGDMQWKIRRVLAYSLHELGRILGTEKTCTDLLAVFEEYCTKDIDDVKNGTLAHLADFFELLPEDVRVSRFPVVLNGLLDMENERNWRYRNTLAEQLILLCDLYTCDYLDTHVYPVVLRLIEDRVAEVRTTASQLLGVLLHKLSRSRPEKFLAHLRELRETYAHHQRWLFRLMYVKQCEIFLTEGRISCEVFATECLPALLQLSKDKVANTRIALAKLLKDTVLGIDYFQTDGKETFSSSNLQAALETLRRDPDRDVKFFAGGGANPAPVPCSTSRPHYRLVSESQSHDSEEQYLDASEYLENELVDLELEDHSQESSA